MKKTTEKDDGKAKVQRPVALIGKGKKNFQPLVGEKLAPPVREMMRAEYDHLLADINDRVGSAQYQALRAVTEDVCCMRL